MIRVLIADDSATARGALELLFESTRDFKVVGAATNGREAVLQAERLRPDMISLDALMPGMSPAQVVEEILASHPVPIILVSGGSKQTESVFDALAAGALDFVQKPDFAQGPQSASALLESFRALSRVKVRLRRRSHESGIVDTRASVLVIGSSSGGPGALVELLKGLPHPFSLPIVVAQHMTAGFEQGFARWVANAAKLSVTVARGSSALEPGAAIVGVPAHDLTFSSQNRLEVVACPALGFHPSADVLFTSAAAVFGPKVLGVILSGIGVDGARGSLAIATAGGVIMAQSKASCAVFGMPGEIVRLGLAQTIASPRDLAKAIATLTAR